MHHRHDLRHAAVSAAGRGLRLLLAIASCGLLTVPASAAEPQRPIEIGVMPYLSTAKLIAGHQPLRRYIEGTYKRPTSLSTAPDFPTFQQRTLAGNYDLIITGPPLAWEAQKAGKTTLVAVADRALRIITVVARNSPIRSIPELRGKTAGVLPPPSFAPAIFADILREHGLKAGVDVAVHYDKTPYNSVKAAAMGDIAAAAYPTVSLPSLPQELLEQVRTIHESQEFPAVTFSVRLAPDLPTPEDFQATLFRFVRDTEEGRNFLKEFGHDGLSAPDMKALRILDRFLPDAR